MLFLFYTRLLKTKYKIHVFYTFFQLIESILAFNTFKRNQNCKNNLIYLILIQFLFKINRLPPQEAKSTEVSADNTKHNI